MYVIILVKTYLFWYVMKITRNQLFLVAVKVGFLNFLALKFQDTHFLLSLKNRALWG